MIFTPAERMIARRYLCSRRREGFISVIAAFSFIGIALGVATLIIVMSVMNGFRSEITGKILGFGGHMVVSQYGGQGIADFSTLTQQLSNVENVVSVAPVINGQAMATSRAVNTGVVIKGMRLEDLRKRQLVADHIQAGSLHAFGERGNIIIGDQLAYQLGLAPGDQLTLISPQGNMTPFGTIPRYKSYTITATFNVGMYEYDSSMIFMNFQDAQVFFQFPERAGNIELFVKDPYQTPAVIDHIYQLVGSGYHVQDWQMLNGGLFNALKVERTVMFLILTLIVAVAAFNIISSLIMLVTDKAGDIAILRTMGASKSAVVKIFFICGATIGFVGTLLGFILGTVFSLHIETIRKWLESLLGYRLFDPVIYFLSELPAQLQVYDVIWAVSMGLVLSFLATIYPAFKASRQDPAVVLRYE